MAGTEWLQSTAVLTFFGGIFVWLATWFLKHMLEAQFSRLQNRRDAEEKERIADTELALKGSQVVADCTYELVYAVIHEEHNGGLAKAEHDIEEYRKELQASLIRKASRQ